MAEPAIEDGGHRTVSIDSNALQELAQTISQKHQKAVEWDAEGWHYNAGNFRGSPQQSQERVALYILALDAINFCFWPHPTLSNNTLEYDSLALALTKLAQKDDNDSSGQDYVFSPANLANMTEAQFVSLLKPHLQNHHLPNTSERVRLWNELGHGLLTVGSALELIQQAHGNAPRLVSLLISTFPGFRDESLFGENQVCFYKRAQIAVGDLNASLQLEMNEMDKLTMFADYRVPQLLRHARVLRYSDELQQLVDSQQEIKANSNNELYIRAATVVAVQKLVVKVKDLSPQQSNNNMTDVAMDWHLWQVGEELHKEGQMKPHHKTRTIFY